ncbi:2OG-Fe dioxygenase family protein [Ideonella sp. BN130291]|uniref:2OG-Fe dioxygenase family protein n=1 Tax=Ideonella sp. BN130291 TaxID=3112940 RepID=UPI002E266C08|nr:2OG-Fe dioxygenase family protein [Ideonella sp. BN130291]
MSMLLSPPISPPAEADAQLRERGYAVLDAAGLSELLDLQRGDLDALRPFWNDLPPDAHLKDGGRYRRRRHSCFVVDGGQVTQVPHRAHWQPIEYNALHGGIERWFEPMDPAMLALPAWPRLLRVLAERASALKGAQPWYVEAHPFRIDTTDGIGRPTPEGAHRDGVDLVAVLLVQRHQVKGGETRVFEADGPQGLRFTMSQPWTTLLLDDARVVHETTPIQPVGEGAHRDTLVITLRSGGFQGVT